MVPQLKKHRELLDRIGIEGMSSDEEDGVSGDGTTIYKFQPPYWMSPDVENLLQWLDLIGTALKRSKQETRGRNPCIRHRNPPFPNDGKTPVVGLPRNVYRREWLASLSDVYREREIAPSSETCDLEIDPEIKAYVAMLIFINKIMTFRKYGIRCGAHALMMEQITLSILRLLHRLCSEIDEMMIFLKSNQALSESFLGYCYVVKNAQKATNRDLSTTSLFSNSG